MGCFYTPTHAGKSPVNLQLQPYYLYEEILDCTCVCIQTCGQQADSAPMQATRQSGLRGWGGFLNSLINTRCSLGNIYTDPVPCPSPQQE